MIPQLKALATVAQAAMTLKNLKTKSTGVAAVAASVGVAAPQVLPPDSLETAVVQVVMGLIALYGFFKKGKEEGSAK